MNISLYFSLAVVIILMLCLAWILLLYEKLHRRYDSLSESYSQIQKLNRELRSQRHDYLNHMQIVYGMAELEEYEELRNYLEPIYRDIMKTGKAIRTSVPAVNALLMAKMGTAEAAQIDFYVEVKSDLKHLLMEAWELCKVLSNLIDNAITALSEKESERKMVLDINEDREHYLFSVSNNGAPIPPEKHRHRRKCLRRKQEGILNMIKVMLIDDEPEIRRLLHKMVEKQEGYQVVSECGDFAGAVADFARYRPDVAFVDIDLNGEDGLNCAKVLTELDPKLKVIFATAHSEYMANAFEIYAFDYLVKPFNMERLAMKRFVKCFFELLTKTFRRGGKRGGEKGRKTRLWTVRSRFRG